MKNVSSTLGKFLLGGEPMVLRPGVATQICETTRAGEEDDGHSVVDKYSKVWRLDTFMLEVVVSSQLRTHAECRVLLPSLDKKPC